MTNYAIVIVPQRRPFKYKFLANLSPPLLGMGDVRASSPMMLRMPC